MFGEKRGKIVLKLFIYLFRVLVETFSSWRLELSRFEAGNVAAGGNQYLGYLGTLD